MFFLHLTSLHAFWSLSKILTISNMISSYLLALPRFSLRLPTIQDILLVFSSDNAFLPLTSSSLYLFPPSCLLPFLCKFPIPSYPPPAVTRLSPITSNTLLIVILVLSHPDVAPFFSIQFHLDKINNHHTALRFSSLIPNPYSHPRLHVLSNQCNSSTVSLRPPLMPQNAHRPSCDPSLSPCTIHICKDRSATQEMMGRKGGAPPRHSSPHF